MTNSVQFTIDIKDISVLKNILETIVKPISNDEQYLEEQEINDLLPQEFKPVPDIDSHGVQYDEAIHSRGKSKLKNGTWKKRRNQTSSPPPPPTNQPENSISYSRFCDEILKRKIDYDPIIREALERLQFDPLPTLANDEAKLYTLLKDITT